MCFDGLMANLAFEAINKVYHSMTHLPKQARSRENL